METWQTILIAIAGNGVAVAVLAFVGKTIVERAFARETERFKLDLQHNADKAIERLRSDFQLRAIEHQVRFSALHERRALAIADIAGLLSEAMSAVESFLSPVEFVGEPSKIQKHGEATNKINELWRFFDKHRIYLPPGICGILDAFIRRVRRHVREFAVHLKDEAVGEPGAQLDAWLRSWEAIKTEVPAARQALEQEFRALLAGPANNALEPTARN